MSELQFAVQRARFEALRDAKAAVAGNSAAVAALEVLLTEAEKTLGDGMYPVGSTVGYIDVYGTVVEHTDDSHVNGKGYVLDDGTWVNARSMFLVPLHLEGVCAHE